MDYKIQPLNRSSSTHWFCCTSENYTGKIYLGASPPHLEVTKPLFRGLALGGLIPGPNIHSQTLKKLNQWSCRQCCLAPVSVVCQCSRLPSVHDVYVISYMTIFQLRIGILTIWRINIWKTNGRSRCLPISNKFICYTKNFTSIF